MISTECAFCKITQDTTLATIVDEWSDAVAFLPRLRPETGQRGCTPGHTLVIPKVHVAEATSDYAVTGMTYARAAELADRLYRRRGVDFHLMNNNGPGCGQTVFHLHVHIIPNPNGGLALPWHPAVR